MTKILYRILITITLSLVAYVIYKEHDFLIETVKNTINRVSETVVIKDKNEYYRDYDFITFKSLDSFHPSNKEDLTNILYTIINNGWDDFTFYCPSDYEECTSDLTSLVNDDELINLMNNYVSPFNSFVNFNTVITGDKEIYVKVEKLYLEEEIDEVNNAIDDIVMQLNINDEITKDDIKKIHDYIINNTTYDNDYIKGDYFSSSYKANGALIKHYSVCSGYADALAIILDRYNIPNFKVSSENHVWNAVKIDDVYLHIDSTWDDDENNIFNRNNFFLINTSDLYKLDTKEHTFNEELYKEFN